MNDEQPATPQSAEPEVWRYMRPGGEWFYTNYHDPDDPDCENGQPLYAATPQQPAAASAGASDEDISYPRDLFDALINGNSPYAFYLFQWVPYQTDARRWRLKMKHDVRAFDGREAFGIWPNGTSCGPFKDSEVEFIRISRKQWGEEWSDPRPAATFIDPTPAHHAAGEATERGES